MNIRYRPMEPRDAQVCAGIIGRHPILGPRYGKAIQHLAGAWLKLLGSDGFVAVVFEELQGANWVALGAGIAVFVSDDFLRELKRAPHFWIGREITLRIAKGDSPVLSDMEVREANSSAGLNIAVWQAGVHPEDLIRGDVGNAIMAAFVELCRGFLLKETVTQAEGVLQGEGTRAAGGLLWDSGSHGYGGFGELSFEKLVKQPHVIGLSRELARKSSGSWNASMFLSYRRPRLGLSRGQQRLLLCGMGGGTDEEMGEKLGLSLDAVRKTWRTIYERVAMAAPELVFPPAPGGGGTGERGKEKKRHLLAYLHEHPEELRPVSRKLLSAETFRG